MKFMVVLLNGNRKEAEEMEPAPVEAAEAGEAEEVGVRAPAANASVLPVVKHSSASTRNALFLDQLSKVQHTKG